MPMGDDVEALCLVKDCGELERAFGTKWTFYLKVARYPGFQGQQTWNPS